MKNFLKWLLGYEEPKPKIEHESQNKYIAVEGTHFPVLVNKDNYKRFLTRARWLEDVKAACVKMACALTDNQRFDLLVALMTDASPYVNVEDLNATNAHNLQTRILRDEMLAKNAEQRRIDDAVATALAKRDQEKAKTDGCATEPRKIIDAELKSVSLNRDGSLGWCGLVAYEPEVIKPTKSFSELANSLVRDFIGVQIPSDAPIEKVHSWAFDCFNSLRRINKEHPAVKKVQAEIDQHNSDAADKKKIEGVVTDLVRPTSLLKRKPPTRPTTSSKR